MKDKIIHLPLTIGWFADYEPDPITARNRLLKAKARLQQAMDRIDNQIARLSK